MSFSRWYPVSPYFYDPAIQPTKPIAKLQAKDDASNRKVPIGRYDTTYRREYLNFNNLFPQQQNQQLNGLKVQKNPNGHLEQSQYSQQQYPQPSSSQLNPYTKLPPITNGSISQSAYQGHPINQAPWVDSARGSPVPQQTYAMPMMTQAPSQQPIEYYAPPTKVTSNSDLEWPIDPVHPNPKDEATLISNIRRQLAYYSSAQLKTFYNELTSYDPTMSGFVHHSYASLTALRNSLPIDDSTLKYIMFKFVSPRQERGFVNYEEMVKYLAKCIGDSAPYLMSNPGPYSAANSSMGVYSQPAAYQAPPPQQHQQSSTYYTESGQPLTQAQVDHLFNSPNIAQTYRPSSRGGRELDNFDPDEQAILRLMHENMRDWDQVNLINTDQLRRKFQEIDPHATHILTLREIEDIVYKNRIPIQRSLIYQIVEKYCKVATGQYSWPQFVEFFDKLYNMRLLNKNKFHYALRDETKADSFASEFKYRTRQLEMLKSKNTEFERLQEINQQINELQGLPVETHQRIDSRMGDVVKGETWFTRFMRLANAMYSHRGNSGTEFTLPKEEARRLVSSYNQVYELRIPTEIIELGLTRCTLKGEVIIDDLLKVLAKVYNSSF